MSKVLVLGAGASKAYGYPLGGELRVMILNMSSGQAMRAGIISSESGTDTTHFRDFQNAFRVSSLYSIDSFLGRRSEFEKIGKDCIAAVLFEREDQKQLLAGADDHWYQYFVNEVTSDSWDDLDFSDIAIVTFNYDRSFETFLLNSLVNGYGKSVDDVVQKLSTLRIVHVYGSLGVTLPGSVDYFAYDGSMGSQKIAAATRHLKVIPEGRVNSDTLVLARKWLSDAEQIAFLGFGFDPTNVERLAEGAACAMSKTAESGQYMRYIIGTCMGLRPAEISSAFESLTGVTYVADGITLSKEKCYDLLRNSLFLRKKPRAARLLRS